ncbi:MAG TPA: glycoside hydrolase family 57 protein [Bryobacteraceae bacterium]|nr:glycoside hydrolase family 57 protein [Bryobacteraceae bacterium]
MPSIHLCFLWHMHQPFYKDLISGEYHLPWTRLHAMKDYYGMVKILDEFPKVRQTFNLVPSMMVQLDEYARGAAKDPFLDAALKPAEALTAAEQGFLLQQSFHADPGRIIYRYSRYGELYDAWHASSRNVERARHSLGVQGFRDLQVLSQLAWFDEEFLAGDLEVRALVEKGRNFNLEDQAVMGRKQLEILGLVLPTYQRMQASGQIEISTTPFYHPILPLLCDSDIAAVSHPGVPLPSRFRYSVDARKQLEMARDYFAPSKPCGLWPSEGSVSDEVFAIAAETGFSWAATDSGVLDRTLGHGAGVPELYRPYLWQQGGRSMRVIFRDHYLSDLIGFVYSKMEASHAAGDFLHRIRQNCQGILEAGRDALVPIILDGENAWEYYDHNGRPFLRDLYRRIQDAPDLRAVTVSEALELNPAQPIDHIFPASWINANFDVWIGADEDNRAWEYLLRARQAFDAHSDGASPEKRKLAYEELLIAEGSDWNWWYGPEHDSANRPEFDALYRNHLANVYRALDLQPPEELCRPILRMAAAGRRIEPNGPVYATIDGKVSSYFEWMGAGQIQVDGRSGSMHGNRSPVREAYYGADGEHLFLRLDFHDTKDDSLRAVEIRLTMEAGGKSRSGSLGAFDASSGAGFTTSGDFEGARCAFQKILEAAIPLNKPGQPVKFQFSLWKDGLPVDAIPPQGWIELATASDPWQ